MKDSLQLLSLTLSAPSLMEGAEVDAERKLKEMICFQLFSRRLVIKRLCDRGPDPFRSYLDDNYKPNLGSPFQIPHFLSQRILFC